jgi:hypothetical protein
LIIAPRVPSFASLLVRKQSAAAMLIRPDRLSPQLGRIPRIHHWSKSLLSQPKNQEEKNHEQAERSPSQQNRPLRAALARKRTVTNDCRLHPESEPTSRHRAKGGARKMNLSMLSELEGKKDCRLVLRFDERLAAAIDELMAAHGRPNLVLSEYVRGLIYIDGLLSGAMPENADIPHWVRRAYPQLFKREKGGTNHGPENHVQVDRGSSGPRLADSIRQARHVDSHLQKKGPAAQTEECSGTRSILERRRRVGLR